MRACERGYTYSWDVELAVCIVCRIAGVPSIPVRTLSTGFSLTRTRTHTHTHTHTCDRASANANSCAWCAALQVSLAYLCALYLLPHQHTTEAQDPSTHLATSNGHVSDPATMNGTVSQEQGQVSSQPTCVPASCESVAGRVELLLRGACKLQVRGV